jgi:hypothetical protein
MLKRLLSHGLISLAVFSLVTTLFIWTIDARILDSKTLNRELQIAGVATELSNLMPQIVTADEQSTPEEKAEMSTKISQAVTDVYVGTKLSQITDSLLTFVREGEPQPVIDISDFPARLRAVGVSTSGDIEEKFAEPIQLNEEGTLDPIHTAYSVLNILKVAGLGLFAVLLALEFWVAEKRKKLQRVSRIFLYTGLSYLIYWLLLILGPNVVEGSLRQNVQASYDTSALVAAVIAAVQGLLSGYFLTFAVASLGIAGALYLLRHFKHGDVAKSTS